MALATEVRFLERAEQQLGVSLPTGYRQRLLRENGGEVELGDDEGWWLFPVHDDSTPRHHARTWDDVVRQTKQARAQRGFPPNAVAIGHDGSGNLLVLAVIADGAWQSMVWDHERGSLQPCPELDFES
jgi:hypothetical protein